MVDATYLQDADYDSAANFGALAGRTNNTDYVEFGMTLDVNWQTPEVTVGDGKAYVLLDREEDSQDPGAYRRRVAKGAEVDHTETHLLAANTTNYVWLVSNESTENSGGEQDQPYYDVNQSGDPPAAAPLADGCLLIGILDTNTDTPTPVNRDPDLSAETLAVSDDVTLGGDVELDSENATVQLGVGDGPHTLRFGSATDEFEDTDPRMGFAWTADTAADTLTLDHEDAPGPLLTVGESGDVAAESGSLGVGERPTAPTFGDGTVLDIIERNDGEIAQASVRGAGQGSGLVYVGQSETHGGGIAYNGDNTPGMPTSTDDISIFRRQEGTDHELLHWEYQSDTALFEGPIDLQDHAAVNANHIQFTPDGNQDIYYDGRGGPFALRDRGNDDEKVLEVARGQMKLSRTLNLQGNTLVNHGNFSQHITFETGFGIRDEAGGQKQFEIIPRVGDIPAEYGNTSSVPQPEGSVLNMDDYLAFIESDSNALRAYIDTGAGGPEATEGGRGIFGGQVVAGELAGRFDHDESLFVRGNARVSNHITTDSLNTTTLNGDTPWTSGNFEKGEIQVSDAGPNAPNASFYEHPDDGELVYKDRNGNYHVIIPTS